MDSSLRHHSIERQLRKGYNSVLDSIARHDALEETLNILAKVTQLTEKDGTLKCSILLLTEEKKLIHGAAPDLPDFYNQAVDGHEISETMGSCYAAAALGETFIVEDIKTHENWCPFRELAEQANLAACWSEPIKTPNGEVLGTFAMYYDIVKSPTEFQLDVIKSSAYYARLAIEINKNNQQLIKNVLIADRANLAKSEFIAHMSHELRTPLNAIIGFAQVCEKEMFGPMGHAKYIEYSIDIRESGEFLLSMISDILDISRIEIDDFLPNPQPIELEDITLKCLRIIANTLLMKKITYSIDYQKNCSLAYLDVRHAKQIIVNILANSTKYTPEGGHITVSLSSNDENCFIIIKDTGIGISEENLPKVLLPFNQLINDPEVAIEGVGLGLPLTKSLIEKNGGTLVIESELDVGTTVTITIPSYKPN